MTSMKEKTCQSCFSKFLSKKSLYCSNSCRRNGSLIKRQESNLLKFGVVDPNKCEEIKNKKKESFIRNYGVDNPMKNQSVNEKMHTTMLKKYGSSHALSNKLFLSKAQDTMIERYGSKTTLESDVLLSKFKKTMKNKYNSEVFSRVHISDDSLLKLNSREILEELNKSFSVREICDLLNVTQTTVNQRFRQFNIIPTHFIKSSFEKEICDFLLKKSIRFEENNRKLLDGKEIDIYIPEFNLAIECNGSYWHTEINGRNKEYHISKTNLSLDKDIHLMHIWEHDWNNKKDIVKSMIMHRLGLTPHKIFSRECDIEKISIDEEKKFLNENHIQGYISSSFCLALTYKKEIVSLMSFGKSRFSKNIELLRFAIKNFYSVPGAASRLFKKSLQENNFNNIISYSHRDKFTGNLYKKLGFVYSHSSPPSYYYTKDYNKFENRLKYQKHKLSSLLENFDSSLTEWENMKNNGYDRIWDCGNDVWKWSNI